MQEIAQTAFNLLMNPKPVRLALTQRQIDAVLLSGKVAWLCQESQLEGGELTPASNLTGDESRGTFIWSRAKLGLPWVRGPDVSPCWDGPGGY